MSRNEKNGFLPSYEDSLTFTTPSNRFRTSQINRTQSPSRGQQILDNLTLVRAQHLRTIINEQIIPIVEQQSLYGIAQTTIAMIPSDVPIPAQETERSEFSFDTGNEKKVEVIGFSSDGEPQIVRLEGPMNKTEFWRPQAIVHDLERLLKESLNASPHLRPPSPRQTVVERPPSRQGRWSLFSKAANQEERSPSGNPEVGVRPPPDNAGQVLVRARLEELCLRTVTDFGLYDTMSRQCIIIKIDARC
ncbi:hypothetical protein B0J11DRAFT_126235 [Dendryphion nanum]|uniref:Uncharacterized protein n=1 Tax=Dendryphion nanum TaxID=256645 RepID=A0A9P9DA01_9PLEO|nr:hypothetical protein B0J11DRAFT_126235 [Dendryphion nanum]